MSSFIKKVKKRLFDAVETGDSDALTAVLTEHKNLKVSNLLNDDGWTLLDVAVYNQHLEIVELLLPKFPPESVGGLPLALALGKNHPDIIKLLLPHSQDYDAEHHQPLAQLILSGENDIINGLREYLGSGFIDLIKSSIADDPLKDRIRDLSGGIFTRDEMRRLFGEASDEIDDVDLRPRHLVTDGAAGYSDHDGSGFDRLSLPKGMKGLGKFIKGDNNKASSNSTFYPVNTHDESESEESDPWENLMRAIGQRRINEVNSILSEHRDNINLERVDDETGNTVLHEALRSDCVEAVDILTQKRVIRERVIKCRNKAGDSCVLTAAKLRRSDALRKILTCVNEKEAQECLDLNAVDSSGNTALHHIMKNDDLDMLDALLKNSPFFLDLCIPNYEGKTPVEMTAEADLVEKVISDSKRFVLGFENLELKTGKSLLWHLCQIKSAPRQQMEFFVSKLDPETLTEELFEAAEKGKFGVVWSILKQGGPSQVNFDRINLLQALNSVKWTNEFHKANFFHVFAQTDFHSAIRFILENHSGDQIQGRLVTDYLMDENSLGNFPAMEAAKYNNPNCLFLLLSPVMHKSFSRSQESLALVRKFIHHRNAQNQTILSMVGEFKNSLFLAHSMLVQMEHIIHEENDLEFLRCVQHRIGSNLKAKEVVDVVQAKNPGPVKRTLQYLGILFIYFLIPLFFFFLDISTDAFLVQKYFYETLNATFLERQSRLLERCESGNLTLTCYGLGPSSVHKFALSLAIIILPYVFYVVEVTKNFSAELREADINFDLDKGSAFIVLKRIQVQVLILKIFFFQVLFNSKSKFFLIQCQISISKSLFNGKISLVFKASVLRHYKWAKFIFSSCILTRG